KVYSVDGMYGNLYAKSGLNTNTKVDVEVDRMMFISGSLAIQNTNIKAETLAVKNRANLNSGGYNKIETGLDMLFGTITVNDASNGNEIKLDAQGDIVVVNDFLLNDRIIASAGGLIAVGGTMTVNKNNTEFY